MAAFTYDLTTTVGQARLYAGDTDPTGLNRSGGDRTRTDEEVEVLLAANGEDPRRAAAALLEGKAAEYAAVAADISQGGLRQDYRMRSTRMLEAAAALRATAEGPFVFNAPARPDVFSLAEGGSMDGW
jgi:hypothetical protein